MSLDIEDDIDSLATIRVSDQYEPLPYTAKSISAPDFTASAGWNEADKGPPEIDTNEIEYDEDKDFLGEGTFGRVYRGRCRGQKVAVKIPVNQNLTKEEIEDFRREVAVMSRIFHPNVVLFMGASSQEGKIMIVTELMNMDLETLLKKQGKKVPLFKRIKMAKDAALGLSWLHGINHICHRDLKPANLLVDENMRVKVTDFGFAEIKPPDRFLKDKFGPRGTALWMAPEVMQQKEFDESIDVYSFGIVLWEIYTAEEPFGEYDDWDNFYKAVVEKGERPPIPDDCPQSLKYLMEACWSADRKKRPAFSEIVFRLDEVLVDVALDDEKSRAFWKKYFVIPRGELQEKVSWTDMVRALCRSTKIKEKDRFAELNKLLVVEGRVTLERFQQVVVWFGHFFDSHEAEAALSELSHIVNADWYHGDIEKDKAESRLNDQPSGSFLVRLSTTYPEYPFTISMTKKQHKRIKRSVRPDGSIKFSVIMSDQKTVKSFDSVTALISGVSKEFNLKIACPQKGAESNYL